MKKARLESLDPKGIPLAEVIQIHRKFRSPQAIANNLGDGFLFNLNPLYRSIRKETLKRGFTFTTENIENYFSFPLMALDHVIQKRKIPYRENFLWLPAMEKYAPKTFTLSEIKRSDLQFNYLFHESAHCIAHDQFFGRKSPRMIPKNENTLLRILLGESFANAVECFSAIYAEGEIGFFFFEGNCHFKPNRAELTLLKRSVLKYGHERVFLLLLLAFLYGNYLYEKLTGREIGKALALANLPRTKDLVKLLKIGLQLDDEFKTGTTQLHLLKIGFPTTLGKLMKDPLRLLEKDSGLMKDLFELVRLANKN